MQSGQQPKKFSMFESLKLEQQQKHQQNALQAQATVQHQEDSEKENIVTTQQQTQSEMSGEEEQGPIVEPGVEVEPIQYPGHNKPLITMFQSIKMQQDARKQAQKQGITFEEAGYKL